MNFKDLFDGNAVILVGAVVAVLLGLVIAAFVQGREISIWPPRIGPRPVSASQPWNDASGADPGSRTPMNPVPPPANHHLFDREFDVRAAKKFYQLIAESYDLRNSGDLIKTQQQVIVRLEQILTARPQLSVLDLGGGTGNTIANHFFNYQTVSWVYVDFAPAMVEIFQHNVAGTKLGERTNGSPCVRIQSTRRPFPSG